jgi:hypothetical protein
MALVEKKIVRKTRSYTARQAKGNDNKITRSFKPERKSVEGLVRSSKKINSSSVLRTEDGLVDLSKTPDHLVATCVHPVDLLEEKGTDSKKELSATRSYPLFFDFLAS